MKWFKKILTLLYSRESLYKWNINTSQYLNLSPNKLREVINNSKNNNSLRQDLNKHKGLRYNKTDDFTYLSSDSHNQQVNYNDIRINHMIVNDTLKPPHRGICKLLFRKKDGLIYNNSTGFFISKNIILTAGHSLIDEGKNLYHDIIITPALHVDNNTYECTSPFGGVISSKYCIRQEFFDNPGGNDKLDYGAIYLEDNLLYDKIKFHFIPYYKLSLRDNVKMSGYEDYDCDHTPPHRKPKVIETANFNLDANFIRYNYDAAEGLSGSPIWIKNSKFTCGIHTSNGRNQINILFNKNVKRDIEYWLKK